MGMDSYNRPNRDNWMVHLYLFGGAILFNLQNMFSQRDMLSWIFVSALGIFLILEKLQSLKPDWKHGSLVIKVASYVILFISGIFMLWSDIDFAFGFGMVTFLIFAIDLYLAIDYSYNYERTVLYVIMFGCLALEVGIYLLQTSKGDKIPIGLPILIFLFVQMYISHMKSVTKSFMESERQIFLRNRMLEDINKNNEEIKEQQEKVHETNLLLGKQKIELQAMNDKLHTAYSEMSIQNNIMAHISTSLELEKLIPLIAEDMTEQLLLDIVAVVQYKAENKNENEKDIYHISSTLDPFYVEFIRNAIEKKALEEYIENQQIYVDNNIEQGKYSFIPPGILSSIIMIPLVRDGKNIGLLMAGDADVECFADDQDFYESIASQIMVALNNANLYAQMENMAIRDGLTNIYSRRHLTEKLENELQIAEDNHSDISVALFDIDKFKSVNDTYGHLCGDEVIKRAASIAKQYARKNGGFAGRYGGEEFVMAFPGIDCEHTLKIITEFHEEIRRQVVSFEGQEVRFRVSVGLTSYPSICKDRKEMLNRADWAMYYSKLHGRDQITVDSDAIREEARNDSK